MKSKTTLLIWAIILLVSTTSWSQPNATDLIKEMEATVGGWDKLWEQKDVQFDYDYHYPAQGIKDFSQERYIFEGEHSWARYTTHQVNAMPKAEGDVMQSLVNNQATCTLAGEPVSDEAAVGMADFLRRANFFWFTMMFKLNNPGANHEYMGTETVDATDYHKVKVTYTSAETGKEANDGYILYINPTTKLVDQFMFSLPALGVNDIILKMKVQYEDINGLKLPTKRYVYMPGEDGQLGTEPSLVQTSTNLTFNNGFTTESFKL
jgi:hypothetical protein